MKTIAASEFKTHCLSLLDDVAEHGETLTILKRGVPVARVLPIVAPGRTPQQTLLGSASADDDLIAPPLAAEEWEVEWTP